MATDPSEFEGLRFQLAVDVQSGNDVSVAVVVPEGVDRARACAFLTATLATLVLREQASLAAFVGTTQPAVANAALDLDREQKARAIGLVSGPIGVQ
jgi:hypothetical protein